MNSPALISCSFGIALMLLYGWMLVAPESFRKGMTAFPRNIPAGIVLVSLALAWFGYNVNMVDFGPFSAAKKALYVVLPLFVWGMWRYTPDLLAVRGLGFLILLAGNPILVMVRWHGSLAHYAVAVLVYLIVIKFCFLIIYPNLWKRGLTWLFALEGRVKKAAMSGMALSAFMLVAGAVSL